MYIDGFGANPDASRLVSAHVRFTPGARTHWHSHPLGQTLHCTDGVGLVSTRDGNVVVLRPGDTVWTPPCDEHWHGGTTGNLMCHTALGITDENDKVVDWLEAVTDEQYRSAQGALD